MLPSGLLSGAGVTTIINLTISASTDNVNLFTLVGSPAGAVDAVVTVAAGITIGSTSTATAAMRTGGFASGSTLRLVNNGRIAGKGGEGGHGKNADGGVGTAGSAGGPALQLDDDMSVNNTATGEIFAGGGGGGGGGGFFGTGPGLGGRGGGGGGGGGQGDDGGDGGGGGGSSGGGAAGNDGNSGSAAGAGTGGNGGGDAAKGGKGGSWGAAGSAGKDSSTQNGTSGGAAGKAVKLNGHTINWIAGNNATQVKGAVS